MIDTSVMFLSNNVCTMSYHYTLQEHQRNLTNATISSISDTISISFIMVVYEIIFFSSKSKKSINKDITEKVIK